MKWCIILMSMFAVTCSRPQDNVHQNEETTVELEKQTIVEVTPNLRKYVDQFPHPTQRKIEDSTKEILEKIAEVNRRQGLVSRRDKPNYFHFPFSYSRSQEEQNAHSGLSKEKTLTRSPFSNPILEYLLANKNQNEETDTKVQSPNQQPDSYVDNYGSEKSFSTNDLAGITKEDIIPGQYIKRKIVHQQTFAIPMPSMYPSQPNFMTPQNMPSNVMPPQNMPSNVIPIGVNLPPSFSLQPPSINENKEKSSAGEDRKSLSSLEKQTVDNIKNIVSNSQMLQSQGYPFLYNPYLQYPQASADQYQFSGFNTPNKVIPEQTDDQYAYRVYGPFALPNSDKGRQNWNWPGANYFPIYIRDPFLQFYNAITSMVEYGPSAGQGGPCKRPPKIKSKGETVSREGKKAGSERDREQIVVEMGDKTSGQITIYGADDEDNNTSSYLDIENIDIGGNRESGLKFTVSLAAGEREAKGSEERMIALKTVWDKSKESVKSSGTYNTSRSSSKLEKFSESAKDVKAPPFFKPQIKPSTTSPPRQQPVQTPPIRDPTVHVEEIDDEFDDDEKSEEISISNDGNKKLFSRDNTGSGIFIHKLKVRKGGVAIAGPGGIATAGSGGTAIVGPNGVAYTQPDSLAIAGSGTKVVAVDPTINLGDLINNTSLGNKTNAAAFPPSRVGKVVAVGPVIYYNKG
ncbi:uncharacterized protein LOC108915636 [Anoplophora glabripennis]|uniref:uncharacterized protein LOC108915636 n=1 Tax=Anoplophora glabripennis TaxID=217634 RepID=UPI000873703C|nr:uncharacterized protein LOC108915636 [Anoplophora glabripennis]